MSKIYALDDEKFLKVAKALSSDLRMKIFKELLKNTLSVQKIAEIFDLPPSTAMVNINKLEDANLIKTELLPGSRGLQKVCSASYDRLIVDFHHTSVDTMANPKYICMPIGNFVDCDVRPSCGIVSENGIIGYLDDPRSFYEPEVSEAQLLWFRHGYVEYRFPNKIPYDSILTNIEISMELCSEAPLSKKDWPSDITLWINDFEIATWMSPGDFGGTKGFLTPSWWSIDASQFGLLKKWSVNNLGSFVDGTLNSLVTINKLNIDSKNFFTVRIGVKENAENQGGLNLFGRKFGNYAQDIMVRLDTAKKN